MPTIPDEVQKASRKVEDFTRTTQQDLERIKGDSEDAPSRSAAAVALRIDGAGWSDIARVLDYSSPQRARGAVEKALGEEAASPEQVEHVRWLNARRLERILQSLMVRATNPKDPDHLAYARMAVVIIDRHIKLYGADAPAELNVTYSPAAGEIEKWAAMAARQMHGVVVEESDIIDAEIVDD